MGRPRHPKTQDIIKAIKAGAPTYADVAKRLKVSRQLVTKVAKDFIDNAAKYRMMGPHPVNRCSVCGHEWVSRTGKQATRCPRRNCLAYLTE